MTAVSAPAAPSHKPTSAEYGLDYQRGQAEKYRNRASNHWSIRVGLAMRLVDEVALPRLGMRAPVGEDAPTCGMLAARSKHAAGRDVPDSSACLPRAASMPPIGGVPRGSAEDRRESTRDPASIHVLDIGTSIGTFAIELAKRGYACTGIDLDADALTIARELAEEEGVSPTFVQEDVSAWTGRPGSVDVAVAFDLFEHLHDDELGALLRAVRTAMRPEGTLIYHTFPTEFDYIFFAPNKEEAVAKRNGAPPLWAPLEKYAHLPPEQFEKKVRAYAARLDGDYLDSGGVPHREFIAMHQHCNPLTKERLDAILRRAGFRSVLIETGQLYPYQPEQQARFKGQPIVDRNLYGAAAPA